MKFLKFLGLFFLIFLENVYAVNILGFNINDDFLYKSLIWLLFFFVFYIAGNRAQKGMQLFGDRPGLVWLMAFLLSTIIMLTPGVGNSIQKAVDSFFGGLWVLAIVVLSLFVIALIFWFLNKFVTGFPKGMYKLGRGVRRVHNWMKNASHGFDWSLKKLKNLKPDSPNYEEIASLVEARIDVLTALIKNIIISKRHLEKRYRFSNENSRKCEKYYKKARDFLRFAEDSLHSRDVKEAKNHLRKARRFYKRLDKEYIKFLKEINKLTEAKKYSQKMENDENKKNNSEYKKEDDIIDVDYEDVQEEPKKKFLTFNKRPEFMRRSDASLREEEFNKRIKELDKKIKKIENLKIRTSEEEQELKDLQQERDRLIEAYRN